MRRLMQWLGAATAVLAVLVGLAVLNPAAAARVLWPVFANARLDDPFVGVTTDGEIELGLFHIRATGVSTEPTSKSSIESKTLPNPAPTVVNTKVPGMIPTKVPMT